jgi:transposase
MEVLYSHCCGIDVHKQTAVACVVVQAATGRPTKEVRTFGTMTDELLALADWLETCGVTHVAMESTGVYWKPLWNLMEDRFTLLLANAQHVKALPGRKTDVRDCEWLADLLRHGLLRPSYVPDRAQRELRELVRYRTSLVHERTAEVNRLQKTLEGANLKLGDVTSVVVGVSGRAILQAIVSGETDPATLADLARGRLRSKRIALERALSGRLAAHQRFMLAEQLCHIEAIEEIVERVSSEIVERLRPSAEAIELLDGITGVGRRTAEILLAEVGSDMSRFPSAAHLASWAGMCPGNNQSAGKRLGGKVRSGNRWLRTALVEAAQAAGRTRGTYLGAQFRRLMVRRGKQKAAMAVGHSILVIVWHMLTRFDEYHDLGPTYFDERDRRLVERRLVRRLEGLGYRVALTPYGASPPAPTSSAA